MYGCVFFENVVIASSLKGFSPIGCMTEFVIEGIILSQTDTRFPLSLPASQFKKAVEICIEAKEIAVFFLSDLIASFRIIEEEGEIGIKLEIVLRKPDLSLQKLFWALQAS